VGIQILGRYCWF